QTNRMIYQDSFKVYSMKFDLNYFKNEKIKNLLHSKPDFTIHVSKKQWSIIISLLLVITLFYLVFTT
ncbi:MAG: hypothetical protein LUE93_11375, partial [Bacteroides sp.]|nr:hypothetical protein [Bacteroides sp.]